MEKIDLEKTEEFNPDKTLEFQLPPETEDYLEKLTDTYRENALAEVRGKAIKYEGKLYICSNVSTRLEMILEDPNTGEVRRVPYTKDIPE